MKSLLLAAFPFRYSNAGYPGIADAQLTRFSNHESKMHLPLLIHICFPVSSYITLLTLISGIKIPLSALLHDPSFFEFFLLLQSSS